MKPWQPLHNFFHGYILAFTTESKEPFIKAEYSMGADVILLLAKWFFPTFYFVWTIPRNFPFRIFYLKLSRGAKERPVKKLGADVCSRLTFFSKLALHFRALATEVSSLTFAEQFIHHPSLNNQVLSFVGQKLC